MHSQSLKSFNAMPKILLFLCLFVVGNLMAQSIDTEFGKNRVQYHDNFKYWSKYETDNFIVYWYGKGRFIAQAAIQIAEMDHDEIRKLIEHKMNDKIEIVVYMDLSDLKQSNIGMEQAFVSKTGETKIVGNKLFVFSDGNHQNLRRQVREGIASVYLNHMLYGSSFQELVQNSVSIDIPNWFGLGLVSFAGNTWNILIEDELRDLLRRDDAYWDFDKLAEDYPRVAGHSMWYFISESFGSSFIANILYLTRISKDVESSVQFVINSSLETIKLEWSEYMQKRYLQEDDKFQSVSRNQLLKTRNKDFMPISNFAIHPSNQSVVYAYNHLGKIRVRLHDIKTGSEKTIFKSGFKNNFQETDYNYPQIVWNNEGDVVSLLFQKREKLFIRKYHIIENKYEDHLLPSIFQRIFSMDQINNRFYIFSASIDGLTNLFIYDIEYRTHLQVTEDFYDDRDAIYTNYLGRRGILFSSNRLAEHILPQRADTLLPLNTFNIFFYPTENFNDPFSFRRQDKRIERLTNSLTNNHRRPKIVKDSILVYLNEESGIINTWVSIESTEENYPITNHPANILGHQLSADAELYLFTMFFNGAHRLYKYKNKDLFAKASVYQTEFKSVVSRALGDESIQQIKVQQTAPVVIPDEYKFQSEFSDPEIVEDINLNVDFFSERSSFSNINFLHFTSDQQNQDVHKFDVVQVTASRLQFKLHEVTTRLDNEVLFEGLELFQGQNPEVNQLPMGLLGKAVIKDLFEDYVFEGGFRLPTTFNGSEFFLIFDNKKRHLDKRYALYRRVLTEAVDFSTFPVQRARKEIILGVFRLSYPFDIYRSLRLTTSMRFDRSFLKSTDGPSFNAPVANEKRLGLRLEYVFDNTLDYSLNIKHGSRYKFFSETFNQFNVQFVDGFEFRLTDGLTSVLGFDARHYIPLLKHSVLAFRGIGITSFGTKRNVYFLGGVNNTLFNRFDESVPLPMDDDAFAFKTYAPHLRGFNFNIRNGSTFLLSNNEIRIPVFHYLIGKNKGSNFLRSFQIVGFLDAGMAWYGSSPYGRQNPINTINIDSDVLKLEVEFFRDPLVVGYGAGIRTRLLGYFVRIDYGRGIETRELQKPVWHFSFGYDF
jgi:hypothetical protein